MSKLYLDCLNRVVCLEVELELISLFYYYYYFTKIVSTKFRYRNSPTTSFDQQSSLELDLKL